MHMLLVEFVRIPRRLQAMRHGSTCSRVGGRSDAGVVANHSRSNNDVIVPEMSDRHGMLEGPATRSHR
jgi:hypothetical protein